MFRTLLVLLAFSAVLEAQVTRVLHFAHLQDPRSLTEAATVIRSVGEIRDLRVDPEARTVTMSGTPWQMDLAAWLLDKLDRASTAQDPAWESYDIRDVADPAVRIFHPVKTHTAQSVQELTTVIRSVVEIRRAFLFNAPRAAVMRGTPDELAAAEWLFKVFDQGTEAQPVSGVWRLPGSEEGVISVFHLSPSLPPEEFVSHAARIRTETKMRRVFPYAHARAVAVRGTADQVALAERLLRERRLLAAN